MTQGVFDLARLAKAIAVCASSTALLTAGLAAFRDGGVVAAEEKPSWLQRVLKGLQLANSFWLAFCGGGGRPKSNEDTNPNSELAVRKCPNHQETHAASYAI